MFTTEVVDLYTRYVKFMTGILMQ